MNMKTKLVTVVFAVAVSWLALIFSDTAVGQAGGMYARPPGGTPPPGATQPPVSRGSGSAILATAITPEEAAKKYPAPKGRYPVGERDPHKASGVVASPYPPHQEFDCSKVAHGGLILDTRTNKVFVRP